MEDVRNACIKIVKDFNGIDVPVVMTFTSIKMRPNPDNPLGMFTHHLSLFLIFFRFPQ